MKLGVLVSGRGSNLQAIMDAIDANRLDASVEIVVSNRRKAFALERARQRGIATKVIAHRDFTSREDFDAALVASLREARVDWIVLAGFMRILTPVFLDAFCDRVINIHPSLLPAFVGVDAQQQALDYGVRLSGCSVHLVNKGVDAGPIIAQSVVPVLPSDNRDALAARILVKEHALLVDVLQGIAAGDVRVGTASDDPRIVLSDSFVAQRLRAGGWDEA